MFCWVATFHQRIIFRDRIEYLTNRIIPINVSVSTCASAILDWTESYLIFKRFAFVSGASAQVSNAHVPEVGKNLGIAMFSFDKGALKSDNQKKR